MNRFRMIFSIYDDDTLLPHFMRHYREQGIDDFACVHWDMCDHNKPRKEGVRVLRVRGGAQNYDGPADSGMQNIVRQLWVEPGDWYMAADLDEFALPTEDYGTLREMVEHVQHDFKSIKGHLVDRITADESLPSELHYDLFEQFPVRALIGRSAGRNVNKVVCAHSSVGIFPGHHWCGVPGYEGVEVHHFSFWGDVRKRYQRRIDLFSKVVGARGNQVESMKRALEKMPK